MPTEANTRGAKPSEWARKEVEAALRLHLLVVPEFVVDRLGVALDAAEARGAARLRERVREAAERHEFAATVADEGGDFGPDRVEYAVEKAIASVLRELEEEG